MDSLGKLDYERPEHQEHWYDAFRWLRRGPQVHAPSVAVGSWVALTVLYLFAAVQRFSYWGPGQRQLAALRIVLPVVLVIALWQVARLKTFVRIMLLIVVTMPLAGIVQFERCPHATYLQIFGDSITIQGEACGNERHVEPCWMRE